MSSIALADHVEGHTPATKEKPRGAPGKNRLKSSIEVENECVPAYVNASDESGKYLKVISRIANESEGPVTITAAFVDGFQLAPDAVNEKKKNWIDVGHTEYPGTPSVPFEIGPDPDGKSPREHVIFINLCAESPLSPHATALNVTTQFMVKEGEVARNFYNNCDDLDTDGDGDKTNDGDQSRIDIEDYPDLGC